MWTLALSKRSSHEGQVTFRGTRRDSGCGNDRGRRHGVGSPPGARATELRALGRGSLVPGFHVRPGDDFFAYANGSWLAKTEIPPDQASTGTGRDVYNLTQEQLRTLIEASAASAGTPAARQIGNLYKSFMDEARVEALDAKPLASDSRRFRR